MEFKTVLPTDETEVQITSTVGELKFLYRLLYSIDWTDLEADNDFVEIDKVVEIAEPLMSLLQQTGYHHRDVKPFKITQYEEII